MIKKFLKENAVYICVYTILFLLTIMLYLIPNYLPELVNTQLQLDKIGKIVTIIITLISLIYFFIIKDIDKKDMKLEKIFLMIAIPIGLIYLFAFPLGGIPDEIQHFRRAYEISVGKLVSEQNENGAGGNILPQNISNIFIKNGAETSEQWFERVSSEKLSEKESFLWFSNTSLYFFVCYIPQALGIFLARIFTNNILILAYAARLCNFAVFTFLIYFSIKLIPFKKIMALIIAFLPIVFQEAVSLAPDAITIAITMLFVSYILHLKDSEEVLTKKNYLIIASLSIVLSLCKIVYIPICLFMYILPSKNFKTKKEKYIILTVIIFLSFIINLAWLGFASRYLVEFNPGVNSKEQVKFLLTHPITYITVVLRTIHTYTSDYISNILGDLSLFTIKISWIYKYLLLMIISFGIFSDNNKENKVDNSTKIAISIIVIGVLALLFTSLYVQWTPVGYNWIAGVQGRYFIPIFILLPFLFNNNYLILNKKVSMRFITTLMLFINLHAISYIMIYYK